jgi:hypothetical protein
MERPFREKAHEFALAKPVINPVRKGADLLATGGLIVVANYSQKGCCKLQLEGSSPQQGRHLMEWNSRTLTLALLVPALAKLQLLPMVKADVSLGDIASATSPICHISA